MGEGTTLNKQAMTSLVALAGGATLLVLAACVTNTATTGRDNQGRVTHHTEWRNIEPHEAIINIADLKGASEPRFLLRTEQRARDNVIVEQRIRFNGMMGYIYVQQAPIFNYATTEQFNDPSVFKKKIDEFYGKRARDVDYDESRKIYNHGKRGGWLHVVRDPDRACIFARVGFLEDSGNKSSVVTDELYDTLVTFRDCSGKRSADDIETFLNGIKIIPPEYNRMLLRG